MSEREKRGSGGKATWKEGDMTPFIPTLTLLLCPLSWFYLFGFEINKLLIELLPNYQIDISDPPPPWHRCWTHATPLFRYILIMWYVLSLASWEQTADHCLHWVSPHHVAQKRCENVQRVSFHVFKISVWCFHRAVLILTLLLIKVVLDKHLIKESRSSSSLRGADM